MTSTYAQVRDALHAVLSTALAGVDGAPALALQDPRLANPDPDNDENRFLATLMPLGRAPDTEQLATPPPFFVAARFGIGLNGVGKDDATREALLDAMATAISGAIDDDWTLGGVVSFARVTGLETDTSKQDGFAPETLLDIEISVEFESLTRLG
jgi:hypothetical protein